MQTWQVRSDATEVDVAIEEDTATREALPWRVILFDDDVHTFEDVIVQLMRATGCSAKQGEQHAWTVHTEGKDCVYEGEFEACFLVQSILREIQLVTEIQG